MILDLFGIMTGISVKYPSPRIHPPTTDRVEMQQARKKYYYLLLHYCLSSSLFWNTCDCTIRCKTAKREGVMIKIGTKRSSRISTWFYIGSASSVEFPSPFSLQLPYKSTWIAHKSTWQSASFEMHLKSTTKKLLSKQNGGLTTVFQLPQTHNKLSQK
jgi:hypothetical protein